MSAIVRMISSSGIPMEPNMGLSPDGGLYSKSLLRLRLSATIQ